MLRPNEFRVCREKGKPSMYATSMGHRLTQSSRALVVKAREAGENRAYSRYLLTRLRRDVPLARGAADRVRQVRGRASPPQEIFNFRPEASEAPSNETDAGLPRGSNIPAPLSIARSRGAKSQPLPRAHFGLLA